MKNIKEGQNGLKKMIYTNNLDVRSSQPFFLGIAVWESPVSQKMKKEALKYLKMLSDESYDLYIEVVKSCDNLSVWPNQAAARDVAKKEVMHALYKNKYTQRSNAAEAFLKREFPLIFSWVRRNRGKGNKSKIPTLMQRRESDFFVGHIMPLFHAMGFWCLTIHDSVVVKKQHAFQVKGILEKEFIKKYGIVPCIKMEFLRPY